MSFIDTNIEFPFSKRLSYFQKLRGLTPEDMGLRLESEEGEGNKTRLIYKYISGEIRKPNDDTVVKLSELLNIKPDHLRYDLGKQMRIISTVENRLENESVMDFLKANRLYGNYEYEDYEYYNALEETYVSEDDFIEVYESMEIEACYKLTKYFDSYINVDQNAWLLIQQYNVLNDKGKAKLKKLLFDFQTRIDQQLCNLNKVMEFVELRNRTSEDFGYNIKENKSELWSVFSEKLSKLIPMDFERFYYQMDSITTMDQDDLDILISYFLIADSSTNRLSEKQELLLIISNELFYDEEYSNIKDFLPNE